MIDQARLEEALALIATRRGQYGDAAVSTAIAMLEEKLATLPHSAAGRVPLSDHSPMQRKQVTILFVALEGFTRLAAAAGNTERLQHIDLLWRQLDETIHAYGGIIDKHMGDVIMGIFGAEISREDDPERAVRCALALHETAAAFLSPANQKKAVAITPPTIRIGINTGQVILSHVGTDSNRTALGDAVNVASRLKEAGAESGIYISHDTYGLLRNKFEVESLGDVAVRGRTMPVVVFRVVGPRQRAFYPGMDDASGFHVPLIGREGEMSVLQAALSRILTEKRGRLVLVIGDVGVGKSRLVGEFFRKLESHTGEMVIFQGRSDLRTAQIPYSYLRELLIAHFQVNESDRLAAIEEKIVRQLGRAYTGENPIDNDQLRDQARAISRLVIQGAIDRHHSEPGEVDGAEGREQALDAVLKYLEDMARSRPTLYLLEDIHWIDEGSLGLLERVCLSAADKPLLMIGLARPIFLEQRATWPAGDDIPTTRIMLQPLNESRCREMAHAILRDLPQISPEVIDHIVQTSAGNPFYVEELIRGLIEDGVFAAYSASHGQGRSLQLRELTHLRIPATLTGVLQARLDRLPDVERVTLQQAAVIGDEFWAGAVQAINMSSRYPQAAEQVEAALQSLERRDIIYRPPTSIFTGNQAYRFSHAVLREVAYESVLLRDRPGYHLQAGQWLESRSDKQPDNYVALIAHHYELGGRAGNAAHLYDAAASQALEQSRVDSAIEYWRKALDLSRDRPQSIDMRLAAMERLGSTLQHGGRLAEARDTYQELYDSAELDGNLLSQAQAGNKLAAVALEMGDVGQAMILAAEAERLARLTGADIERMDALLLQADATGQTGARESATIITRQALELGRALDASHHVTRALSLLAEYEDK